MHDFSHAIKVAFQNYANFQGRSTRAEYWWWTLFVYLAGFLCLGGDKVLYDGTPVLGGVFLLVTLVPSLAIIIRRFHDVGRSGWCLLLPLTIIGVIPYLYWLCQPGKK